MSHRISATWVHFLRGSRRWLPYAVLLGFCFPSAIVQAQSGQGTLTDVADFNGTNGLHPNNAPFYDTQNGQIYGTTTSGGANNEGNIYSFNPNTAILTDVVDFNTANGVDTIGDLVYDSNNDVFPANGAFYGLAHEGGANGDGALFSFSPITGTLTDIADFNGNNGAQPIAALVDDSELYFAANIYYGIASIGGANNEGDVYSFNPMTGALADVADFSGTNIERPTCLAFDEDIGEFYGTTFGGLSSDGSIYSFNPTTDTLANVVSFNGTNGKSLSSLVLDTATGVLYGTASEGGANNDGDVYSFNPRTGTLTDIADFNGTNGKYPDASLVYDEANGLFYGLASEGGANNEGTVFSLNPATAALSDVADFNGTNGDDPTSLGLESATGVFYGTTYSGGTDGDGTLFSFILTTTTTTAPTISPSSPTVAQAITLTAAVAPATATGTVTFTITSGSDTSITETSTLASGTASVTIPAGSLPAGTYSLKAAYSGDAVDNPSLSPQTGLSVALAPIYTFTPGLQMACLDEQYSDFSAAVNGAVPPAYITWNGSDYDLYDSTAENAPEIGTGFWIAPTSTVNLYDTGVFEQGVIYIGISQGWNMIGDPVSGALPLSNITVMGQYGQTVTGLSAANAALLLYSTLYTWGPSNTTAYTTLGPLDSLQPFMGYWLYAFQKNETLALTVG